MTQYHIILGNKRFSSWSLRGWLVLRATNMPFEETVVPLGQPNTADILKDLSPTRRVPVLKWRNRFIWDSLAIAEFLNERHPEAELWPRSTEERALARSVTAEMHSGFLDLRSQLPMDLKASQPLHLQPEVKADIRRIQEVWEMCRAEFGVNGDFLFGDFTIADAFFAPVAVRFRTYHVPLSDVAEQYTEALWNHPHMQEWTAAAMVEPWKGIPGVQCLAPEHGNGD